MDFAVRKRTERCVQRTLAPAIEIHSHFHSQFSWRRWERSTGAHGVQGTLVKTEMATALGDAQTTGPDRTIALNGKSDRHAGASPFGLKAGLDLFSELLDVVSDESV